MKDIGLHSSVLLILLLSSAVQADQETLYSSKSYPYNLLLSRTESVKIIYIKDKDKINCKVEVSWKNKMITTLQARVSKIAFNKGPLASCLPREKAKNILAKTFE
ncbi:MAG: hypothetical protein ACI9LM_000560 [Alteromonadaceae bacterium]|jgi:hypothetical protein